MAEMTRADAKRRMDWLVAEINRNDRLYYVEARPVIADADYDRMYEELIARWRAEGIRVETGRFRTEMQVSLVNDGPVTILLDSEKQF